MEEKHIEIEKRLQELIRQKTEENSALHKLLGRLSDDKKSDLNKDLKNNNPTNK